MKEHDTKLMFSKKSDEWATPQEFYDKLNKEFKFTLDPCATDQSAKCKKYYTMEDDGLSKDWTGSVFVNPPYSKSKEWVEKAIFETAIAPMLRNGADVVVMLLPSRTDTRYFHEKILPNADEIRFVKGRLKFGRQANSAPFPSMVAIFRKNKTKREDYRYFPVTTMERK